MTSLSKFIWNASLNYFEQKSQTVSLRETTIYLPAKTFINRILDLFRRNQAKKIHLDSGFHKDTPIPHFDSLHLDASLTGLGVIWSNRVYATPVLGIPGCQLRIVHLEMFNIVVALRLWAKFWSHSYVRIHCDNMTVVQVVKTSKTKDQFLAA